MKKSKFLIISNYIFVIFLGVTCYSQEKRMLTQEDYKLWNTLNMGATSEDGIWTSYSKSYENNVDTLFLKNTSSRLQYSFPAGYAQKITPDGEVFAYKKTDTLFVLETLTGHQVAYPNVNEYAFLQKGRFLIYRCASTKGNLVLKDRKSGSIQVFNNVAAYSINPTETHIAIVQEKPGVSTITLAKLVDADNKSPLFHSKDKKVSGLTWNASGTALAYYLIGEAENVHSIGFVPSINTPQQVIYSPTENTIAKTKLYISDKGDKVFFDTSADIRDKEGVSQVEIWKTSDKHIPPKSKSNFGKWHVWLPLENKVHTIEEDNLIVCALTDTQEKAVLLDNDRYLPLYEYGYRYSDVYLMDLNSGEKKRILEKQLRVHGHLVTTPNGQVIAYFKDNNWWSYNIETDTHSCVSCSIDTIFNKSLSDRLDTHEAYGFGGWTTTGEMMVYDAFDIWLLSPDGKKHQRLTDGISSGVRHRIITYGDRTVRDGFFGFVSAVYALSEGLFIKTLDTENLHEGFGEWHVNKGFQAIVQKEAAILYVKKLGKNNGFQILESSFAMPPKITYVTKEGIQEKIAQANEQQQQFYWGKSKLIHYQSPNGVKLKGALFYPANYNPLQKYPMVVSIYENKSSALHEYVPPTLNNYTGFNITNFTQEGYFVLLPDISYTLNEPGMSALACVAAAMEEAALIGSIDTNHVGLIGHSFGGFETSYIISQTNMFKAAVASAGVHDLLSFYLDIDSSNLSNMERFESEQFRNKIAFTEKGFTEESPITQVQTIDTPVLLWTGDSDKMVPPSYSIKMFAALWRLQKESILLIYPNEAHILLNPINQEDISSKTMSWFNHYLKNHPKEKWMDD